MLHPKPISAESIGRALAKAERYRLLNEPREAESICRDVLAAAPGHAEATVLLLLSITDQFGIVPTVRMEHAWEVREALADSYERAYFAGVIIERWAKARLAANEPGHLVLRWFRDAMEHFEEAERLAPAGNEDAILRWNTCARIIAANPTLRPRPEESDIERAYSDH